MRGLNARKPGANPLLHLGMVEFPVSDPGFFALRSSFRDLISFGAQDSLCPLLVKSFPPLAFKVLVRLLCCWQDVMRLVWPGTLMHRLSEMRLGSSALSRFLQEVEMRLAAQW